MSSKQLCKGCAKQMTLSKFVYCRPCRTKPCLECGKPTQNGKPRCWDCRRKRNQENDGPGYCQRLGTWLRES